MLIKLNATQALDSDDISSVVEAESAHKPLPGAAFDFKSDTLITLKNAQVIRVSALSVEDVLDIIKQQTTVPPATNSDYLPIMEDILKTLGAIKEHVHTTSEMITRLVLERK